MDAGAATLQDDFLGALLDGDVARARRLVDEALAAGVDPRELYLGVLQPALYEVGARWSRAEISVAQEHLATAATQSLMARLAECLTAERGVRRGTVLVACADDELHALGARMVADFLEAEGWDVTFLGALTPAADLAALARDRRLDVVAISAALPERLPHLIRACTALKALDPAPFVVVGGQAFAGSRRRALATGADAYAEDAAAAATVLAERFA